MFKRLIVNHERFLQRLSPKIDSFEEISEIKEQQISVAGQTINYIKTGNGDHPILLYPGALGTIWNSFTPQIDGLDKNKFTIIAWDPPGYGKSRPPNKKFTKDFYEEDADKAYEFMKMIGIKQFSLLGWSDGGISSMILSAKYPDSVRKLITWGSNSYIIQEEIEAYQKLRDIRQWSNTMKAPFLKVYTEDELYTLWSQWNHVSDIIFREGGNICKDKLKFIKCPTLIIHGNRDPLIANEHPKYLLENIKRSRLYYLPKGRHNLHLVYAEEFNAVVTKFLEDF